MSTLSRFLVWFWEIHGEMIAFVSHRGYIKEENLILKMEEKKILKRKKGTDKIRECTDIEIHHSSASFATLHNTYLVSN